MRPARSADWIRTESEVDGDPSLSLTEIGPPERKQRKRKRPKKHRKKSDRKKCRRPEKWEFAERAKTLKRLGFESYEEYLESSQWKEIRSRVRKAKGRKCHLCSGKADHIHHNRYEEADLLGETLEMLEPLCDRCHKGIHFTKKGRWRTLQETRHVFAVRVAGRSSTCPTCGKEVETPVKTLTPSFLCDECRKRDELPVAILDEGIRGDAARDKRRTQRWMKTDPGKRWE